MIDIEQKIGEIVWIDPPEKVTCFSNFRSSMPCLNEEITEWLSSHGIDYDLFVADYRIDDDVCSDTCAYVIKVTVRFHTEQDAMLYKMFWG